MKKCKAKRKSQSDNNFFNLKTLWRAMDELGKSKGEYLAFIYGFCLVELCCTALYSFGIKGVINAITAADMTAFVAPMCMIVANHVLWWTYSPISTYFTGKISAVAMRDLKTSLCTHIIGLPMSYHDVKKSGELLSALSNDANGFADIYDRGFFQILRSATGGIGGVIVMAVIDWRFAAVVFTLGSLSVFITSYFSRKLEAIGSEQQERLAKTTVDAHELVRAAKTIRLLNMENERVNEFERVTGCEAEIKIKGGAVSSFMNGAVGLVNTLSYMAVLFAGAVFVRYGLSDWGTVIALLALKGTADMLFVECGQFLAAVQGNIAGVKRVSEIADVSEEGENSCNTSESAVDKDCLIQMKGVNFAYDGERRILSGFDLSVRDKRVTAIIGESGSGKSTVIKLLLGLYEPDSGSVSASGGRLREITAYVPQEPALFRGTVYENIAFGRAADIAEVRSAAVMAGADEFIMKLESGYETVLADCGQSLSGGQKQRIAIARALMKREASALLCDEITSALDKNSESRVIETLLEISKTRAVVIVTHKREIQDISDEVVRL